MSVPSSSLPAAAIEDTRAPQQRRQSLTWAQRLRCVVDIDVTTCDRCGGPARIILSFKYRVEEAPLW